MNFIVAFKGEAQPIIERFNLIKSADPVPYPLYENESHRLILTGIGSTRASEATSYLIEQIKNAPQAILNIGLAGHRSYEKGSCFIANRISSDHDEAIHYPPLIIQSNTPSSGLKSCSEPEKEYPENIGYDMEAHSICSTAYQSITRELVQFFKIVSDNPQEPLTNFDPKSATELIHPHIETIDDLVTQLDELALSLQLDPKLFQILEETKSRHHFTFTQNHQFEKLLHHARALDIDISELIGSLESAENATNTINILREKIAPLRILP